LADRLTAYRDQEKAALERHECRARLALEGGKRCPAAT
jgi:hypothetical protein